MIRILPIALATLLLLAVPAAAQQFFYTYTGTANEHALAAPYTSQADANDAAAADPDLAANTGAVNIPYYVTTGWIRRPPATEWLSPAGATADEHRAITQAAKTMVARFSSAVVIMDRDELAWPATQMDKARAALRNQEINAARFALSPDKSAADRLAFLEEVTRWPVAAGGLSRRFIATFVDDVAMPGATYSWVDPTQSPPTRYSNSTDAATGFAGAVDVADAPDADDLRSRSWIRNIP